MACVVNMGDVYQDLWTCARSRGLGARAVSWLERRFPREVAGREDWSLETSIPWYGDWRWLARLSKDDRERLDEVRKMAQEHDARAIAKGDSRVFYMPGQALRELGQVCDWLAALPETDPSMQGKLSRISWPQAVEHCGRWHGRLAKAASESVTAVELAEGAEAVTVPDDGWRWVRLTTPEALDREGLAMGHCVGFGGYDTLPTAEYPDGIYSLRDGRGRPHVTVEARHGVVVQVQGKGNTPPTAEHTYRLGALIKKLGVDVKTVDPGRFGMARVDGLLMPLGQALERLASGPVESNVDSSDGSIKAAF